MTYSTPEASAFIKIISHDGWTLSEVGDCLKRYATQAKASDAQACSALLTWLDAVPQVGEHATGRRFTRLQFVENTLSRAGYALTLRDFGHWFDAAWPNGWRANELLPYAPQDRRLLDCEARVEQLAHELHQMEVKANRARAEVNFVVAERDQFMATNTAEIYTLISQDYESSASWRITAPLRRAMAVRRDLKASFKSLLRRKPVVNVEPAAAAAAAPAVGEATPAVVKPKWEATAAPWNQPGYSTEAAWRVQTTADFDRKDYTEWVRRYDVVSNADVAAMRLHIDAMVRKPLISILMVVVQPDAAYLVQAITSVMAQIYPHWELCIAVDKAASPACRAVLEQYAAMDSRIKLVFSDAAEVAGSASLLNRALDLAKGDWVFVQNAIDLIAKNALFITATAINEHKYWKIIYFDEDKLLGLPAQGVERSSPNFKPDWNVDLFYAQNYIAHGCVFYANLLRQAGGFDVRFEQAGTFDVMLRCLEHVEASQIGHIARVLCHVREIESSDSESAAQQALTQGQAALNAHFLRTGVGAKAKIDEAAGAWRVSYTLPAPPPQVSLIVPTKNNAVLLRQCLESILRLTSYANYEILVVDNGSDAPQMLEYLKTLATEPKIRVIRDNYEFNYSALNNDAVKLANGMVVGLVNDDIEVKSKDWLSEMVSQALRPGIGAVGARLWYPDHTLQHAGMVLVGGVARHVHKHLPEGALGYAGRAMLMQEFSAVTGACLVIQKALFEKLGGLNERELAIGFNDVDFCLRLLEAGYRNVWTPYAELFHHESATRGQDDSPEKQRRAEAELRYMRKRWGDKLNVDPAYNPNLTDGHDDFSLAWPPRAAPVKIF